MISSYLAFGNAIVILYMPKETNIHHRTRNVSHLPLRWYWWFFRATRDRHIASHGSISSSSFALCDRPLATLLRSPSCPASNGRSSIPPRRASRYIPPGSKVTARNRRPAANLRPAESVRLESGVGRLYIAPPACVPSLVPRVRPIWRWATLPFRRSPLEVLLPRRVLLGERKKIFFCRRSTSTRFRDAKLLTRFFDSPRGEGTL